jgi:hypothetical protein
MGTKTNATGMVCLLLWLALGTAALAQGPVGPQHSDPAWHAVYWNNTVLSGTPVLQRTETAIDHHWGSDSPDPAVRPDRFSARWTRYLDLPAGVYRFTASSDDGLRVFVDGDQILNMWYDHGVKTISTERSLAAGHHLVVVEFYENLGAAVARFSWQPVAHIQNWRGEYYANRDLSGSPALIRDDPQINFNWGSGSPAPGSIGADNFSVRWTRSLNLAAGTYRFRMTVDDGGRLWVNQHLLIDAWRDQAPTTYTGDLYLPGGPIPVQMEFYENAGGAVAQLSWQPVAHIQNWRGEYYASRDLSGSPALIRDDPQINFNWGSGSPAPGSVGADNFSVRWTRSLNLAAGTYRFRMTVDDGGRLWVNQHLLIDAWRDQAPTTYTGDLYLPGGPIPVQMEFYENAGGAVAQLSWQATGDSSEPVAVIMDNGDPGFIKGGATSSWRSEADGYGGDLFWTWNNDRVRPGYNWARWTPDLAAGRYEVSVYIPYWYTTTAHARYWIRHADGYEVRIISQSGPSNEWISLGTFRFLGDGNEYVSLADVTFEPYRSRLIAFDAVRWMPR